MAAPKRKVYAYITYGKRLLVFRHVNEPEAGIQVPGGTVEAGESFESAVLREAREETGLPDLEIVDLLGEQVRDWSDIGLSEIHYRQFFHLRCTQITPETWRNTEADASDGSGPHLFEFFWVKIPDEVPELSGEQNVMISKLLQGENYAECDRP